MKKAVYVHGTNHSEQERLARLNALTNDSFIHYLDLTDGSSVLEVGCGLGILAETIAARYGQCTVYGVEYSPTQLAFPKSSPANVRYVRGDAHSLPFPDNFFDKVYCRYVLEHVADAGRVVREMYRVLRHGGRAYVQENNALVSVFDPDCPRFDHLWRAYVTLQATFGGDPQVGKKLYALFTRAGFDNIALSFEPEIHPAGTPTFRLWVENLIDIVTACATGLHAHGLATAEEMAEGIAEARAFLERNDATALFYWNRATAVKFAASES